MSTAKKETKEQEQEDKEFLFSETRTALSYARTMMAAEPRPSWSTPAASLESTGYIVMGSSGADRNSCKRKEDKP